MQPLFTEKRKFANKITLQGEENISDDTLVSEELNNFLMILLFPENMILFFRRKVKDDLSQKKLHGNTIFSENVLKRMSFQKTRTGIWYFVYYQER